MSQGSAINSTEVKALVEESPPSFVQGQSRSLSLTPDGRLRVAVPDAPVGVAFFSKNQEDAWGELQADITFGSPPWSTW